MSVTFAGQPLRQPTREQERWVRANVDPRDVWDFAPRTIPGAHIPMFPFAGGVKARPVSPHALFWPAGASRWAVGYFLATDEDLAAIRPLCFPAAGGVAAQPLVMGDGTYSITAQLYLLPPRPLSYAPGGNQLYLLTLVDQRYFWYDKASAIAVTAGTTTWAQLYTALGTALGVTITADTVAAAYLKPDGSFTTNYEDLPIVLDAVAWSCGQRVVCGLDGTVSALNVTSSQASVAAQLALRYPVKAGGAFALTSAAPTDLPAVLPASVTVTFPKATDNAFPSPQTYDAYTKTLAGLALPEFAGVVGHAGSRVYHDTAVANYHTGSPTNASDLQALTDQIATDAYRYAASLLDVVWNGVIPWVPEGLSDAVEWTHGPRSCATRVTRPAWNENVEELLHYSVAGAAGNDPLWDFAVEGDGSLVDQMCGQGVKTFQGVNFGQGSSTPAASDMKMAWDGNAASRTLLLQGHDGGKANLSVQADVIVQQHLVSRSSSNPPTLAADVGAGTGPTVSIVGTDHCGVLTVTTGTGPSGATSRVVRVTPFAGFTGTVVPMICPLGADARGLTGTQQVQAQASGGVWDIISGAAALTAARTYQWNYHVLNYTT